MTYGLSLERLQTWSVQGGPKPTFEVKKSVLEFVNCNISHRNVYSTSQSINFNAYVAWYRSAAIADLHRLTMFQAFLILSHVKNTEQTAAKQYTVCLNKNAPTLASCGFHMQINFNKFWKAASARFLKWCTCSTFLVRHFYLLYYAALLPRRGPHIASHSVCLSVCLSVRPSRYHYRASRGAT